MAFWCSRWALPQGPALALLPSHSPSTRPWAEPCIGRCRTPYSQHPSMAFRWSMWDPHSCCLRHSNRRHRRRGSRSGTQYLAGCLSSMTPAPPTAVTNWVADSSATNHTTPHPTPATSPHPDLLRLPTLPQSLSLMVLSYPSPQ
jgi:hypothetical protein